MKMTTGILGCALAAGLVTFASSNAQASGISIDGDLYASLTIKAKITEVDDGKLKSYSYGNKDILEQADLDVKGAKLALNVDEGDVAVIIKEDGDYVEVANLTDDGANNTYAEINLDDYIGTFKESSKGYESSDQGAVEAYIYQYTSDAQTAFDEVDLYGNYSDKFKYSENNKGYKESYSMTAKSLSGEAYSYDGDSYSDSMPVSGSISANGNASFDYVD